MSDTPETDHLEVQLGQAATHSHPILWEHSRNMERERNDARNDLDNMQDQRDLAMKVISRLERERDEAREELKHITEYGTEEINAAVDLRQMLATAFVERDEALSQIVQAECRAERFCQERDEAQAALMKIEDLFIDGTDTWADRENMGLIARAALEGVE